MGKYLEQAASPAVLNHAWRYSIAELLKEVRKGKAPKLNPESAPRRGLIIRTAD